MTNFLLGDICIGGSHGKIEHLNKNGIFVDYLDDAKDNLGNLMQINGITFDRDGNIYTALAPSTLNIYPFPWDVVWIPNNDGLISIMAVDQTTAELWKTSMDGTQVLKKYAIQTDINWISDNQMKVDISCDNKTVFYSDSGKTIFKYDISDNGTQLTPYKVLPDDSNYILRAFKLLPDDTVLVNMSASGNGPAHALCLSNDGISFWIDEINPPDSIYYIFRRNIDTFAEISNSLANLNPDSINDNRTDIVWSLASYYIFCNFPGLIHYDKDGNEIFFLKDFSGDV